MTLYQSGYAPRYLQCMLDSFLGSGQSCREVNVKCDAGGQQRLCWCGQKSSFSLCSVLADVGRVQYSDCFHWMFCPRHLRTMQWMMDKRTCREGSENSICAGRCLDTPKTMSLKEEINQIETILIVLCNFNGPRHRSDICCLFLFVCILVFLIFFKFHRY